ncbi:hypothetical protein F0562_011101 [Nyssa sinensis]|uniref:Uncharacterized protein n=1 Tax=Nyssa sinensis TaxID=561372 RepID=A0A5J5A3V8_9ASTE|nr:hypothetical protein F0562_011101 [Nyssa sinensis]
MNGLSDLCSSELIPWICFSDPRKPPSSAAATTMFTIVVESLQHLLRHLQPEPLPAPAIVPPPPPSQAVQFCHHQPSLLF